MQPICWEWCTLACYSWLLLGSSNVVSDCADSNPRQILFLESIWNQQY